MVVKNDKLYNASVWLIEYFLSNTILYKSLTCLDVGTIFSKSSVIMIQLFYKIQTASMRIENAIERFYTTYS